MNLKEAVTRAGNEADEAKFEIGQSWAATFIMSLEQDGFVVVPKEAVAEVEKALEPMAGAGEKLRKIVGDEDISDWAMNYRGFKVADFDAAITALAKLRSIMK